jgi:predicted RNA binding protein YcfA (HicA-like mRNA interferase family)
MHGTTTILLDVPRKIRELIAALNRAGFRDRGGKGSHRNFQHPKGPYLTPSGKSGDDAHHYQEKIVMQKIDEANLTK